MVVVNRQEEYPMPKVINKRHTRAEEAVYIGRPSRWGNPFIVGEAGDGDILLKLANEE